MKNIAVLGGGYTSERQISLNSANQVFNNIDKTKYNPYLIDVCEKGLFCIKENKQIAVDLNNFSIIDDGKTIKFDYAYIVLHGSPGEDGKIQGYLDMLKIPYSSCGVFSSAVSFDKIACKKLLADNNIAMAKSVAINDVAAFSVDEILSITGLPCFVKPSRAGSSFGITKVYEKEKIIDAINIAATEDNNILIEEFINGTEVSCGILKTKKKTYIFPITEICSKNDFFDTTAKYKDGLSDEITPARLSDIEAKSVQQATFEIYDILNCKGIVRVDYIIKNGIPYFLELNSIPGMSAASIIPKQIQAMNLNISDILTEIICN